MPTLPRSASAPRLALFVALLGWVVLASAARAADRDVVVLPTTGVVDNVMALYLEEGIAGAQRSGAAAVIIRLNTPGGSLDATQRIVSTILDAPLPVIVWVAPSGGRAASAGTFITLAAHVAAMAPGTNIGAASPVGGSGEDIEGTLGEKVKNDAMANIRSIAETRKRNVDWAVETVRDARSSAASEAVALGAVDGLASSVEEVLALANGRQVTVAGQPRTLDLAGAAIREAAMNPFQGFLHLLSDPNIAFILFTLGFYGLLFELQNPNFVTGILGALAIILAFVGFGSLPLNVAGLLLIGLAIVLFVLEATVTSHGLLAVGGLICFALGASALYTIPGDPFEPVVRIGAPLLAVTTLTTAALVLLIAVAAARARRSGPTGPGLVGAPLPPDSVGVVRSPLAPLGTVYLGGEEWSARSADGTMLERGARVRIVRRDGLTLVVAPVADPSFMPAAPAT
jgi:membrane-bound serine protease (ClpP class)